MNTDKIIIAARKHLANPIQESSARFCLAEAVARYDEGKKESAYSWALKSLAYSIGVFHPEYRKFAATSTRNLSDILLNN